MKISKSKQELARIISENGGWRKGSYAAQDSVIRFFIGDKPKYNKATKLWDADNSGLRVVAIGGAELLQNWQRTTISRAEYFHLYPAPDADGWIEWKGGECPVERGAMIDVKYANGITNIGVSALTDKTNEDHVSGSAGSLLATNWDAGLPMSGIIAYRLHNPEQSIGELCDKVTEKNKHDHADAKPTIEQMAADYHNAKDYAERKQQEADAAKADAQAKLKALELAGEALGLLVSPITAKQEPEPVYTKLIGKFHSAEHGDRPESLDMICDRCGKSFGTHVGFDCCP